MRQVLITISLLYRCRIWSSEMGSELAKWQTVPCLYSVQSPMLFPLGHSTEDKKKKHQYVSTFSAGKTTLDTLITSVFPRGNFTSKTLTGQMFLTTPLHYNSTNRRCPWSLQNRHIIHISALYCTSLTCIKTNQC